MLLGVLFCFAMSTMANDSVRVKLPHFFSVNSGFGSALPNTDFMSGRHGTPLYSTLALKYGFAAYGRTAQDYLFGQPYVGVGIDVSGFYGRRQDIGLPVSIYLFQGAELLSFSPSSSLNYEFNLGGSFNWNPYDPFTNPDNDIIGKSSAIHFSAKLYYNWKVARKFDLKIGADLTHFSNGARRYPNNGMNMAGGFMEVAYHLNREKPFPEKESPFALPPVRKTREQEILLLLSNRNTTINNWQDCGLSSPYVQRNFRVLGLGYSYLFVPARRVKWGPSVELSYDESGGVTSRREVNPRDGLVYDRIIMGKPADRFSLGVSMKGEFVMPYYSFFANLGYDFIQSKTNVNMNAQIKRLYQIIGVKFNLNKHFFVTAAVRAVDFSVVHYLYMNIGYTIL